MNESDHTKEFEMRDATVPFFDTEKQLHAYIDGLVKMEHDYGTCVYAMSSAAVAAFNFVARRLGCTGFQTSMADLDILRRTLNMKGPFRITNYEHLLYPQYCTEEHFPTIKTLVLENITWLAEQAQIKLDTSPNAHPNVVEHWQRLIALNTVIKESQATIIKGQDEETVKEVLTVQTEEEK